jgi:hypothetical protein
MVVPHLGQNVVEAALVRRVGRVAHGHIPHRGLEQHGLLVREAVEGALAVVAGRSGVSGPASNVASGLRVLANLPSHARVANAAKGQVFVGYLSPPAHQPAAVAASPPTRPSAPA